MMGYYASNIMDGESVKTIQWNEVDNINLEDSIILDVREEMELMTGTIPNSINIPLGQYKLREETSGPTR